MKSLQWHISPYSSLKLNIFFEFLPLVAFSFIFVQSLISQRQGEQAVNNRDNQMKVFLFFFFLPGISTSKTEKAIKILKQQNEAGTGIAASAKCLPS